jgi:hypothetical protein
LNRSWSDEIVAGLEYLIYFCVCALGVFVCVIITVITGVTLGQLVADGPAEAVVNATTILIVLCLGSEGSWVSHNAARRTSRDGEHPIAALRGALNDELLCLPFLPWMGRLFGSRRPKRSPFDGPDDVDVG